MSGIMKFFTLFGKDIIEAPLKIIDRELQVYNARKDKEHAQKLQIEQEKFFMELSLQEKEINAKIEQSISDKHDERVKNFLEYITRYQQEMAGAAVSISRSLGLMGEELEARAQDLVLNKKKDYDALQDKAYDKLMNRMAQARERFPEGSDERKIAIAAAEKIANGIIDNAISFINIIDQEFLRLTAHIQEIQKQSLININEYLSPALAKAIEERIKNSERVVNTIDMPKRLN